MDGSRTSKSGAVDHKRVDEFERLTLAALRLARAAIFYFVDLLILFEARKSSEGEGLVLSSRVPDHEYIRGDRRR